MNTAETVTAIIAALGGAAIIPKLIDGWKALASGRAKEEKDQNRSLLTRVVNAEKRFDLEADFRRHVEEWGGRLVYMLVQMGVPEDKIPTKPTRKTD